ncbi:GNAT family N-acetyltransferase [Paenibacillus sp. YPG26]|uniref:GNAT family N-acetyltransferase n=1 Tax=Paenibacillus sp. YPG26 TaxID=2878915 RepID=UPI00203C2755|nr:GNAT family N-acetyltransferase [Paenibacillus sp. YPG26]USB34853.1 GNAT family N-acetyltransferase [Paenibacillus sp. YPG26]
MITHTQWGQIAELEQICNAHDGIHLKLNWDMLRTRREDQHDDYVAVRSGRIVGYLGLYCFGHKIEACGMVHPDYRRQGLFSSLLGQAFTRERRESVEEILLNAPANSLSAKGLLQSLDVQFAFSEYQMTCSRQNDNYKVQPSSSAALRPAVSLDRADLIKLDELCFDYPQHAAEQYYEATIDIPNSVTYIIEADGRTAGKVRVVHEAEVSWIYGLAIYPEYRRQGLGRDTLKQLIQQAAISGRSLRLEVALNNPGAMKLYKSVGFQITEVQDYYRLLGSFSFDNMATNTHNKVQ